MSPSAGRRGKRLLVAGLIVTTLGVVGLFPYAMFAALFVPICQPGAHGIREGRCAVLWYEVLAMELLVVLCLALVVVDLARRARSGWRAR